MGCCSVTARGTNSNSEGHEEVELLQKDGSRNQSAVSSPCSPPQNGGLCCIPQELTGTVLSPGNVGPHTIHTQFVSKPILFWGKSREDLNHMILTEPIQSWEGQDIKSYGRMVMSSLAVMQISHTQEMSECFMVLFPLHLLILSMDHQSRKFIYQGLLPLSGMRVVCTQTRTGYNFEISGPMIEPRLVSCLSSSERSLWIKALEQHIQEANTRCTRASLPLSILSYLMPCDQLWKKKELVRYLTTCPIQEWQGKPIQHMGCAIYMSAVQAAHTIDGTPSRPMRMDVLYKIDSHLFDIHALNIISLPMYESYVLRYSGVKLLNIMKDFEDWLMVMFPEDLVFLFVDPDRTAVIHQGTLPLNAIHIEESFFQNERLEFLIAGELMDPILIVCTTSEDYSHWIFYLQKPQHSHCSVALHPRHFVQPKYRRYDKGVF